MINPSTLVGNLLTTINCRDRVANAIRHGQGFGDELAILAIGKAAPAMVEGATKALHELGVRVATGLGITKSGYAPKVDTGSPGSPIEWIEGDHPMPGEASLRAGKRLQSWLGENSERLLVLLSGGASAVVEQLVPGLAFESYQAEVRRLLLSGVDIRSLNTYRREVSVLKGGKLGALLADRLHSVLVVSDVLNDDLSIIGSGMFYGEETAGRHKIVSSAKIELPRLAEIVQGEGYETECLPLMTDANALADSLTARLSVLRPGQAILGMGECPVKVNGNGLGGRCSYLAHHLAPVIAGTTGVKFLALATDGTDGPTPYAGGFVDENSYSKDPRGWREAADRFDSATWLLGNGFIVETGPTGTNINDLYLLWRD